MPQLAERTPSPWLRLLAGLAGLALVGSAIVLSVNPASAAGLEAFASCDELRSHLDQAAIDTGYAIGDGGAVAEDQSGAPTPTSAAAGDRSSADGTGGDGGTNTQVAGIDELDLVEVLADGRILVARADRVLLLDAGGREVLATLPVPASPQITFDEDRSTLWVVSSDWQTTSLTRALVSPEGFAGATSWSVAGRLVDLRRDGATSHLVAVDDEVLPVDLGAPAALGGAQGAEKEVAADELPFSGTSPVPCDQVLHSPLPGGPATTLVASFSATGPLEPVAATEIVGAGDNVLVTSSALYVSTPTYDGSQPVTGIHRFELQGLRLAGSGSVEGRLINQFALDEHDGHLRAAVTADGFGVGRPMPVDDVGVMVPESAGSPVVAPAQEDPSTTTTTPPDTTTTEAPTTTTTEAPTTSTTEAPTTTEPPATTTTVDPGGSGLNEIVTFDLDGALDVVGRSPRFGHEGETLHGIRFAGDVAYAVTFLQTDPLYVIDLADPTTPKVLGQLEIPGFSAYLHPISATQVIGFGPGEDGSAVARLFDVGDPAAPRLLDTVGIGAESPVVWDHHALRADGDRLLVAANDWVAERPDRCGPLAAAEAELEDLMRQLEEEYRKWEQAGAGETPPALQQLEQRANELSGCVYPSTFPQARIVILDPTGSSLGLTTVATDAGEAQRVLTLPGGDFLVVGSEVSRVSSTGAVEAVLAQAEVGEGPRIEG